MCVRTRACVYKEYAYVCGCEVIPQELSTCFFETEALTGLELAK